MNRREVMKILEDRGIEFSFSDLENACRMAKTIDDAVSMITAEKPQKVTDPDMTDYMEYKSAVRSAEYWASLRAQVAETASTEDVAYTSQEAESERAFYSAKVDECLTRAWKHFSGAARWAKPSVIYFPYQLSKTWNKGERK